VDDALRRDAHAARAERLRGPSLLERLLAVPAADRDAWVDALLGVPEPPPDAPLPRGAVPYLPAGVDEILAMAREAPLRRGDVLVDLGSGLGRVAILAHLLSGARAHGVEIQEALVREATACCARLGLSADVTFTCADAASSGLDGSVFFLYAPFNGELLARVMRRVEAVARHRPIVVCAAGLELPDERWLRRRETSPLAITLYDSISR